MVVEGYAGGAEDGQPLTEARFLYALRHDGITRLIESLITGYQWKVSTKLDRGDFKQEALLLVCEACRQVDPFVDEGRFYEYVRIAVSRHFDDDLVRPYFTQKRNILLETSIELLDVEAQQASPEEDILNRDLLVKLRERAPDLVEELVASNGGSNQQRQARYRIRRKLRSLMNELTV